jgi:hypothetical protein
LVMAEECVLDVALQIWRFRWSLLRSDINSFPMKRGMKFLFFHFIYFLIYASHQMKFSLCQYVTLLLTNQCSNEVIVNYTQTRSVQIDGRIRRF